VSDAAQSFSLCSKQDIRIGQKGYRSHHVIEIADQKLFENTPGILFQDLIVEEIQYSCNEKQYEICRSFSDTLSEIFHTLPRKSKKDILCCLFRKAKNDALNGHHSGQTFGYECLAFLQRRV
jgi:hypothetical protein